MRTGVSLLRQAVASTSEPRRCYRRPSRAARLVAEAGKRWQDELRELSEERQGAGPQQPPAAAQRAAAKPADSPRPRRAPLQIVKYPSPLLRRRNEDVTLFDAELARLAKEMFSVMYRCARPPSPSERGLTRAHRTDGVGLAAPQVGINRRLMVYNPEGAPGEGEETVLCNPVLVESSAEEDLFEEGCLSFPEIYADVKVRAPLLAPPHRAPEDFTTNQIYANPRRARTPAETERNEGSCARAPAVRATHRPLRSSRPTSLR